MIRINLSYISFCLVLILNILIQIFLWIQYPLNIAPDMWVHMYYTELTINENCYQSAYHGGGFFHFFVAIIYKLSNIPLNVLFYIIPIIFSTLICIQLFTLVKDMINEKIAVIFSLFLVGFGIFQKVSRIYFPRILALFFFSIIMYFSFNLINEKKRIYRIKNSIIIGLVYFELINTHDFSTLFCIFIITILTIINALFTKNKKEFNLELIILNVFLIIFSLLWYIFSPFTEGFRSDIFPDLLSMFDIFQKFWWLLILSLFIITISIYFIYKLLIFLKNKIKYEKIEYFIIYLSFSLSILLVLIIYMISINVFSIINLESSKPFLELLISKIDYIIIIPYFCIGFVYFYFKNARFENFKQKRFSSLIISILLVGGGFFSVSILLELLRIQPIISNIVWYRMSIWILIPLLLFASFGFYKIVFEYKSKILKYLKPILIIILTILPIVMIDDTVVIREEYVEYGKLQYCGITQYEYYAGIWIKNNKEFNSQILGDNRLNNFVGYYCTYNNTLYEKYTNLFNFILTLNKCGHVEPIVYENRNMDLYLVFSNEYFNIGVFNSSIDSYIFPEEYILIFDTQNNLNRIYDNSESWIYFVLK